jgi:hypothetical protein
VQGRASRKSGGRSLSPETREGGGMEVGGTRQPIGGRPRNEGEGMGGGDSSGRSHGRFDLDRMSAHQSSVHTHRTAQTETIHVTRQDGNFALRAPRKSFAVSAGCRCSYAAPTTALHPAELSFLLTRLLFPPPRRVLSRLPFGFPSNRLCVLSV